MSLIGPLIPRGPSGFRYSSTAEEVTEGMSLAGKTILITGMTSGVGEEAARVFVKRGARVIGTGRKAENATEAFARMHGAPDQTLGLSCELADPSSVRACVDAVKKDLAGRGAKLDVIIANAGIMALPRLEKAHGYELQFFTNHVGHFILVTALEDVLADDARVVVLSSTAHARAPREGIELDNLDGKKGYDPWRAYGQSKLANLLFAKELARRFRTAGSQRKAFAVHPGVIATKLTRHLNPVVRALWNFGEVIALKDVHEGAATEVFAAVHPWVNDKSGAYLSSCNVKKPLPIAEDEELAKKLWEKSEAIVASLA
jgi:WW domain-containing oxidoreductase